MVARALKYPLGPVFFILGQPAGSIHGPGILLASIEQVGELSQTAIKVFFGLSRQVL